LFSLGTVVSVVSGLLASLGDTIDHPKQRFDGAAAKNKSSRMLVSRCGPMFIDLLLLLLPIAVRARFNERETDTDAKMRIGSAQRYTNLHNVLPRSHSALGSNRRSYKTRKRKEKRKKPRSLAEKNCTVD
jgi:hypothetical protein